MQDIEFTEEQVMIRDMARDFARGEIAPHAQCRSAGRGRLRSGRHGQTIGGPGAVPGQSTAPAAVVDIRSLYDSFKSGDTLHEDFFVEEYALDLAIHNYRKPGGGQCPVMAVGDGDLLQLLNDARHIRQGKEVITSPFTTIANRSWH